MTIRIERIEIVLPIDGRTGTVMAQRVETANGRTSYIEPVDLMIGFDGSELPKEVQDALAAIDAQQQATITALTAERDSLQSQLATVTNERDTALSEKASLQTELDSANATIETLTTDKATLETTNAELQTSVSTITAERDSAVGELATANERIAELTAVAEQPVATLSQIRVWLLQTLGVNAIKQVDAMIAAIPDELERAIAYQQWEYANNVLRDNPFVLLIAQQLNLTSEQMDEAYLAATRIV